MASIYCTHKFRSAFPTFLVPSFGDLDDFLRRIIGSATKRVTIVAPYLSTSGIISISGVLAVASERGVCIKVVTELLGDEGGSNAKAVEHMIAAFEGKGENRIRILANAEGLSLLHSKLILADSHSGYLGSANLSRRGLERNFEVGVSLEPRQVRALDDLIDHFETSGILEDRTDRFVPRV